MRPASHARRVDAALRCVPVSVRLPEVVPAGPVELSRPSGAEAAPVVDAMAASRRELARWFAWAAAKPDVEAVRRRLEDRGRAFGIGDDDDFVMVEGATAAVVGSLRLDPQAGPGVAGIGYWVRTDRHRRGHAAAATRAVTAATFEHLRHVERIEIHMDQANAASTGVAAPPASRWTGRSTARSWRPGTRAGGSSGS
jgi:RimJ/RimL family protein N-acetyltransferase